MAWTIGWSITKLEETAIKALPARAWAPYLHQDGTIAQPIHYDESDGETHDHAPDRAPGPDRAT